jgi:hypothetical protein
MNDDLSRQDHRVVQHARRAGRSCSEPKSQKKTGTVASHRRRPGSVGRLCVPGRGPRRKRSADGLAVPRQADDLMGG